MNNFAGNLILALTVEVIRSWHPILFLMECAGNCNHKLGQMKK